MANPAWGIKRICQHCSSPFYDLNKSPIVCPKCSGLFDPEQIYKARRTKIPLQDAKDVVDLEDESDIDAVDLNDTLDEDSLEDDDVSDVIDADVKEEDL